MLLKKAKEVDSEQELFLRKNSQASSNAKLKMYFFSLLSEYLEFHSTCLSTLWSVLVPIKENKYWEKNHISSKVLDNTFSEKY